MSLIKKQNISEVGLFHFKNCVILKHIYLYASPVNFFHIMFESLFVNPNSHKIKWW